MMLILALQGRRVPKYRIMPRNKNFDKESFLPFLQNQVRHSMCKQRIRHQIILMNNARSHYQRIVSQLIENEKSEVLTHQPTALILMLATMMLR